MRGRLLTVSAIGRAAGLVLIAGAIVATTLHFRHEDLRRSASVSTPSTPPDALARELVRCQSIGTAAQNGGPCKAAWAESRRRFFTYRPSAEPEDR